MSGHRIDGLVLAPITLGSASIDHDEVAATELRLELLRGDEVVGARPGSELRGGDGLLPAPERTEPRLDPAVEHGDVVVPEVA